MSAIWSSFTALPRARLGTGMVALGLVLGFFQSSAQAQSGFVVQASRDVRDAASASLANLEAGRVEEGLDSLQFLLEEGREALLTEVDFGDSKASFPTEWIGAAAWARARIEALAPELRERYGDRTRRSAERALDHALYTRSTHELLEISRRYPATTMGAQALIARGDIAFETGNGELALRTWSEALRTLALAVPQDAALSAALALRLQASMAAGIGAQQPTRATAQAPVYPPQLDSPWTLDLPPAPRESFTDYSNIRPVVAGNVVWINTGLRILAVDMLTGRQLWDSGETDGWQQLSGWERERLIKGVARDTLISQVAVDETTGILVGALQLSQSDVDNDSFGSIQITVALPERRLFAFDSQSGEPLWDHAPRLGTSISLLGADSFEKQMRVAAPPLIQDGLVFVSCYEMAGRITQFVAAYDLLSGELVWRTRIVSGQMRVNLFGVHESEYNSAPLAMADGKLLVVSQLGVISALDLETGEPVWETSYTKFELPKTNGYYTPERARVWQSTAPIIADGIVFATPVDSPDLLAYDLETGERFWSSRAYSLGAKIFREVEGAVAGTWGLAESGSNSRGTSRGDVDHLIAASRERVWLGGDHVVSWTNEVGDLSQEGPGLMSFGATKTPSGTISNRSFSPRALAVATPDTILAPTDWGVLSIDRNNGSARPLGPFGDLGDSYYTPGSLGLSPGVLVHADEWRVTGWMHWGTLVRDAESDLARARELRSPYADRFALKLALLRLEYASSPSLAATDEWDQLSGAAELLFEADGSDKRFALGGPGVSGAESDMLAAVVVDARYQLLVAQAEWQGAHGKIELALNFAEQALVRSPSDAATAELLHAQIGYINDRFGLGATRQAERLAALDRLIGDCPREATPERFASTALDSDIEDFLGNVRRLGGPYARGRLPVGLTARLARAAVNARDGKHELSLGDLHSSLWEYGLLPLASDTTLADLIKMRLLIAIEAAPAGTYDSFEAAASAQLELAQGVLALEQHAGVLAGVIRRWPHSAAASRARTQMLDVEIQQFGRGIASFGDLALRVTEVQSDAPSEELYWRSQLALGWAANLAGNPFLARTLLEVVDREAPKTSADFTGGKRASELLSGLRQPISSGPADQMTTLAPPLAISSNTEGVRIGPFDPILTIDASRAPSESGDGPTTRRILLAGSSQELYAFGVKNGDSSDTKLWTFPVGMRAGAPWSRLVCALPAAAPEVICAITSSGIAGIDPISGQLLWSEARAGFRAVELSGSGGLLVVQWLTSEGLLIVEGIDALGGARLWQAKIPAGLLDEYAGAKALVSGSSIALLSRENDSSGVLIDGTRGTLRGELRLVGHANHRDREAAWVLGETLFIPHFFAGTDLRPNTIDALDLTTGELRYSIEFGLGQELAGIAQFEDKSYLWLLPTGAIGAPPAGAELVELDAGLGATRKISNLGLGDRIVGLPIGEILLLDGPLVLVASRPTLIPGSAQQGPMKLRAFGLPNGLLWTLNISPPDVLGQGLYDGDLPPIVLARNSIIMTYAITKSGQALGRSTRLLQLDRTRGKVLDDRALTSRLGRVEGISLRGLGTDLYLFGRGIGSGRGRLEVLGGAK